MDDPDQAQQKTMDLDRGIFIVRYAGADDDVFPPKVRVSADESEGTITPILHPDDQEPILWHPGTALVVQVTEPGQLLVEVIPTGGNHSVAATVRIEVLTQGKQPTELALSTKQPAEVAARQASERDASDWSAEVEAWGSEQTGSRDFRILGHVAGRGDVYVSADEWIGGPTAPARIEGLAVEWPGKPEGLNLRYAVKSARPEPGSTAPVELGTFVGSRGRALPIVGLLLELSGAAAARFELSVDALFLSGQPTHATGQRVVLAGPTGREPLVGFRFSVTEISAATKTSTKTSTKIASAAIAAEPEAAPERKSAPTRAPKAQSQGRVRVFRSTTKSKA